MYVPAANAVDDLDVVCSLLRRAGFGHLVSAVGGLDATGLPFLVDDGVCVVRAHLARANRHWRELHEQPVMLLVAVTDAYVSPSWYPSKADDPRVVPTWNYEVVHLHGTATVRDDAEFLHAVVRELTELHESRRAPTDTAPRWSVDDAPPDYIDRLTRAIVGVEVRVERVEAKRKLSQNRSEDDRRGVADGLEQAASSREDATAVAVRSVLSPD